MRYRTLGKTGLQVSELAMGGAFITERAAARADGIAAVRRALELGLNLVDTAAGYSDSEEVLGLALDGVPQPYILSTKLGGRPEPFVLPFGRDYRGPAHAGEGASTRLIANLRARLNRVGSGC